MFCVKHIVKIIQNFLPPNALAFFAIHCEPGFYINDHAWTTEYVITVNFFKNQELVKKA